MENGHIFSRPRLAQGKLAFASHNFSGWQQVQLQPPNNPVVPNNSIFCGWNSKKLSFPLPKNAAEGIFSAQKKLNFWGTLAVQLPGTLAVQLPGTLAVQLPGTLAVQLPGTLAVQLPGDDLMGEWRKNHARIGSLIAQVPFFFSTCSDKTWGQTEGFHERKLRDLEVVGWFVRIFWMTYSRIHYDRARSQRIQEKNNI